MADRLGFLGPVGTYTEEAALLYTGDRDFDLQPFPSIPAVGSAVISGIASKGVVPIENSLEGSVNFTLDLLIGQPDLSIQQEVVVPIEHYLMAKPGTALSDIEVIYSHPKPWPNARNSWRGVFPTPSRWRP